MMVLYSKASSCYLVVLFGFGWGDAQIGQNVTPIDSASVESEVWYGKESRKYISVRKGDSVVYSLLYPFEGLWNYTSGIIHHVKLKGMLSYFLFGFLLKWRVVFIWCWVGSSDYWLGTCCWLIFVEPIQACSYRYDLWQKIVMLSDSCSQQQMT